MRQSSYFPSSGLRGLLSRAALGTAPAPRGFPRVYRQPDDSPSTSSAGLPSSTPSGWDDPVADPVVARAVDFARERSALSEQIAMELVLRPELREAPEPVQDFLLQVWAVVMAHARLTSKVACEDPAGYLDVVAQLLWSVHRERTMRRPAKLVELIPGLLQHLREGLALLGREPVEDEGFFHALEALHQPALQLCAARRTGSHVSPAEHTRQAQAPQQPTSVAELQTGAWVDMFIGQQWMRARLEWVDPQGRQFLFASQRGQSHTMTRRILERLWRERLLRTAIGPGRTPAA